MDDFAKLSDNVHRLTKPHTTRVETDEGFKVATLPPLIDQLRAAKTPSGGAGHGGAPTKQRLPIDAGAFDLFEEIEAEAKQLLAACSLARAKPRALEDVIVRYRAAIQGFGAAEVGNAAVVTERWISRIEDALTPPPQRRPMQQPCPSCGELWDCMVPERRWALTAWTQGPMTAWEVYCSACGAEWLGQDISFLLRATNAA